MIDRGDRLLRDFRTPPAGYGQTPFWWWSGEKLDLDRLRWQLDQLRAGGVRAAVIGYCHHPDGSTDVGDPPVFSPAWWDLLRAVLEHAARNGMALGMQDYCLLGPALERIGARGGLAGLALRHGGAGAEWPAGSLLLETSNGEDGTVLASVAVPTGFDPLHPESGERVLQSFYEPYRRELGAHLGSTFRIFFQDELDLTSRFPFWRPELYEAFARHTGGTLDGRLHELAGSRASGAKLRIDFADLQARLVEERYFRPVYAWMERHGCLFGHDNAGRGSAGVGRAWYGDYMRAMRWYSAPGSDDPDLRGPRAFRGLKVASSIAHLHDRPRVWAECFHSSGWGATPAEIMAGVNAAFALGANLINLHGLYYTTRRTGWEWAPPDFHFRQPYWKPSRDLTDYVERLSWLLSQGRHECDAAVLYPTEALAGRLNELSTGDDPPALSEAQRGEAGRLDSAEAGTFAAAEALFQAGVDFDFVDAEAITGAAAEGGMLRIGKARYRALVLVDASAMSQGCADGIARFARSGGRVIAIGRTDDRLADVDSITSFAERPGDLADRVVPRAERWMTSDGSSWRGLRRNVEGRTVWFIFNAGVATTTGSIDIGESRGVLRLDALRGAAHRIAAATAGNRQTISFALEPGAAAALVEEPGEVISALAPAVQRTRAVLAEKVEVLRLPSTGWAFSLSPTLDNRFGDYSLTDPACDFEMRKVLWRELGSSEPWTTVAPGFAPRARVLGPVPAGADVALWEEALLAADPDRAPTLRIGETTLSWREHVFSQREGLLYDPWLADWRSGPHGLKGVVPPHWIDAEGALGETWYFVGWVHPSAPGIVPQASSRSAFTMWINGREVVWQEDPLGPGVLPAWGLPHYDAPWRAGTRLAIAGRTSFAIRLQQSAGQRVRAAVRFDQSGDEALTSLPIATTSHVAPVQCFRLALARAAMTVEVCHYGELRARRGHADVHGATAVAPAGQITRLEVPADEEDLVLEVVGSGRRAGDCLISPVRLSNVRGHLDLGDWSSQGLAPYSGGVAYEVEFEFVGNGDRGTELDLGRVMGVASVELNGTALGTLLTAPWRIGCSGAIRPGTNRLRVLVHNTLANHFAEFSSTGYVFPGQTVSGLLGPVRLVELR